MRSLDLDAAPQNIGYLHKEARRAVTELLKFHISVEAHTSTIQQLRTVTDLKFSYNLEKREAQKTFDLHPSPDTTFGAIIAVVVRAVGLLPDSTLVDLHRPFREFEFYVHTQAYHAKILCIAAMPKSMFPSATFKVKNIKENIPAYLSNLGL